MILPSLASSPTACDVFDFNRRPTSVAFKHHYFLMSPTVTDYTGHCPRNLCHSMHTSNLEPNYPVELGFEPQPTLITRSSPACFAFNHRDRPDQLLIVHFHLLFCYRNYNLFFCNHSYQRTQEMYFVKSCRGTFVLHNLSPRECLTVVL